MNASEHQPSPAIGANAILAIDNLQVHYPMRQGFLVKRAAGVVRAVDGVSLSIAPGEVVGLVGESGCGKSTLARAIMQLIQPTAGQILLDGRDMLARHGRELSEARAAVQMVFQDPYASLNPRMTVFDALAEPLLVHGRATRVTVADEVARLLERVGLDARLAHKYPHEFSGGQRQRIAIARALALRPRLILADEPVSALDVSIQAQILNLLAGLTREMHLSMLFIAHDLSVVKHISDRIAVMYLGRIVEIGRAEDVIERPQHPYTRALISAIPLPDPMRERSRQRIVLPGDPPSPLNPPSGCAFHPRCRFAAEACRHTAQMLQARPDGRFVACMRVDEIA